MTLVYDASTEPEKNARAQYHSYGDIRPSPVAGQTCLGEVSDPLPLEHNRILRSARNRTSNGIRGIRNKQTYVYSECYSEPHLGHEMFLRNEQKYFFIYHGPT